ncbi:phage holin family protein [Tenacibaculum sp. 190524A02b]|uniref:phage holin family protein n=1 Tax=Tenacibaculum vairaonense TaxID=3137860 RepID=UPI0031FA6BB2
MKQSLIEKILNFDVINKAMEFKSGALMLFSLPMSFGLTEVLDYNILKDVNSRDLYLLIVLITLCIVLYFICWLVDFGSGIVASKYINKANKDWFESDKAYMSIGKIGGVLLVNFIFFVINIVLIFLKISNLYYSILIITVMLNVVACSYEVHSIGENIKKRTNEKPRFFEFFDKVTSVIEDKIIAKINDKL